MDMFDGNITVDNNEKMLLSMLKKNSNSGSGSFLDNFVPEESNRERKKQMKYTTELKKPDALYDSKGLLYGTNKDLCDCLDEDCPGCFFPCLRCRSNKCGHECRQNRSYMYDCHVIIGTDTVITKKN